MEVVLVGGVAELGENGGGEVLREFRRRRRGLHIDGSHCRRNAERGATGAGVLGFFGPLGFGK